MKFDMVFDVQEAYRKVLHAFSYPGEIVSLQKECASIALDIDCMNATKILMFMLLDADTTFHVVEEEPALQHEVSQITYCVHTAIHEARYVILPKDNNFKINEVLSSIHIGTLENPDQNACVIVECGNIQTQAMYELQGPGIKNTNILSLQLPVDWIEKRASMNCEYPLGVDMMFIDDMGNCVAIPRTTQIERMK